MTAEAASRRRLGARPWGTGLASLVPEWLAIALFLATGVLWFVYTQPIEVLRTSMTAPDEPLTWERWALVYSSIVGSFAVVAGLLAVGVLLFVRRPRPVHGPAESPLSVEDEVVRLERAMEARPAANGAESARKQFIRARLAMIEARLRATRGDDPEEIARAIEGGRDAMQDLLTELRSERRPEA